MFNKKDKKVSTRMVFDTHGMHDVWAFACENTRGARCGFSYYLEGWRWWKRCHRLVGRRESVPPQADPTEMNGEYLVPAHFPKLVPCGKGMLSGGLATLAAWIWVGYHPHTTRLVPPARPAHNRLVVRCCRCAKGAGGEVEHCSRRL